MQLIPSVFSVQLSSRRKRFSEDNRNNSYHNKFFRNLWNVLLNNVKPLLFCFIAFLNDADYCSAEVKFRFSMRLFDIFVFTFFLILDKKFWLLGKQIFFFYILFFVSNKYEFELLQKKLFLKKITACLLQSYFIYFILFLSSNFNSFSRIRNCQKKDKLFLLVSSFFFFVLLQSLVVIS